jgi:hypothetical protein
MTAPVWLHAALASVMIAVAIGCALRLGLARRRGLRPDLGADGLHAAMGAAMVFMLLPAAASAPGSAFAGPSAVLALLLALCMVGYAIWTADTLVRGAGAAAIGDRLGVRLAAGGSITMSAAMWYMLIQMV